MDPQQNNNAPVSIEKENRMYIFIIIGLLVALMISGYLLFVRQPKQEVLLTSQPKADQKYAGKKVVYVDSYNKGYAWSDGIAAGIKTSFEESGIELDVIHMDTKLHTEENFKLAAGEKARVEIEAFHPDVLIVSDDNAFKYVVQKYYKDAPLPVVFCGVNWDASVYGVPYTNTTGMVEVSLTTQILENLKPFAKGSRLGYLSADTETEHKNLTYYEKLFGLKFEKTYFVKDMDSWKKAFAALQKETDLVIFENSAGIVGWNDSEAQDFAQANIVVPVGTTNPWTMRESVLGITKIPNEQGEWAAGAALRILDGARPSDIPMTKNEKGSLFVNLKLAEKLNIVFSPNILKNAQVAE